jgi:hypothetical protein
MTKLISNLIGNKTTLWISLLLYRSSIFPLFAVFPLPALNAAPHVRVVQPVNLQPVHVHRNGEVLGSSIAVLIRTSTSMRGLTVWPDWQGQATDGHASMQGQVESMLPTLVLRSSTGHSM